MIAITFLALMPWIQAQLTPIEFAVSPRATCRLERQLQRSSIQQHRVDGGSAVRVLPVFCSRRGQPKG